MKLGEITVFYAVALVFNNANFQDSQSHFPGFSKIFRIHFSKFMTGHIWNTYVMLTLLLVLKLTNVLIRIKIRDAKNE